MLRQFIGDSSKITAKQVTKNTDGTYEVTGNAYDSTYIIKNNDFIFVKLDLEDLEENAKIAYAQYVIQYAGLHISRQLEIIRCDSSSISDENIINIAKSLNDETSVDTVVETETFSRYSKSDRGLLGIDLKIDITSLFDKGIVDKSIMFVIRNNNSTNDNYAFRFIEGFVVTYYGGDEVSTFAQTKQFDLGFAGVSNVILNNGKLFHTCGGINTNLKNPQISYPINIVPFVSQNQRDFGNIRSKYYFECEVDESITRITFTNYLGIKKEYVYILPYLETYSEEQLDLIEKLHIKKENLSNSVYYCSQDGSYLCFTGTTDYYGTLFRIELFTQQNNRYSLEVLDNIGYVKEIEYQTGEKVTFSYNDDYDYKLVSINNQFNEKLKTSYETINNQEMVRSIINNASTDVLRFDYDTNNKVKEIQYLFEGATPQNFNVEKGTFEYDGDNLISISDNVTRRKITFTYNEEKVEKVEIKDIDKDELLEKVTFTYLDNVTKVEDFKGNEMTYFFNKYGQCIDILDSTGKYITMNYDYIDGGMSKNLTGKSKVQNIEKNLLQNFSFENPDIFETMGWKISSSDASKISQSLGGVHGEKCLLMNKDDGNNIVIYQEAIIPPTYSNYISLYGFIKCFCDDEQEITTSDLEIKLEVEFVAHDNAVVTWTPDKTIKDWKKFYLSAQIPEGETIMAIRVYISLLGKNCKVYLDDFQLENKKRQARFNYVENGYFEKENIANNPISWTKSNLKESDKVVLLESEVGHPDFLGKKVMKFTGGSIISDISLLEELKSREIKQTVDIKGVKGDHLIFSAMAKGRFSNKAALRAKLTFNYSNLGEKYYIHSFTSNYTNWQLLTREFIALDDYDSITITFTYIGASDAYLDAVQLYKDSYGLRYNYDKFNQISEVINEDGTSNFFSYDDNNRVQEVVTSNGEWFRITYGDNKKVAKVEDYQNNVVNYIYDSYQNCTKVEITNSKGEQMTKEYYYDASGFKLVSEKDELGNLCAYTYDKGATSKLHGLITSTSLNNSINYNYGFNEVLLPESISNSLGVNNFIYNNKKENKNIYNDKVNFEFSENGDTFTTKINDVEYCTEEYAKKTNNINHNVITKQTFDDGTVVNYEYDEQDNLTSMRVNGNEDANFSYDENNNVSTFVDNLEDQTYYFDYLSDGKLNKITKEGKGDINYVYDNLGQVQKESINLEEVSKSYDYMHKTELDSNLLNYYFVRLSSEYGDEIIKGSINLKGLNGATPKMKTTTGTFDDTLNLWLCTFETKYQFLWYDLSSFNTNKISGYSNGKEFNFETWKSRLFNNKTFYMWIKPTGTYQELSLMTFRSESVAVSEEASVFLSDLIVTSEGYLGYKPVGGEIQFTTSNKLNLSQWNLVGIQFSRTSDSDITGVRLALNGESTVLNGVDENVAEITHLLVGYQTNVIVDEEVVSSEVTTTTNDLSMPFDMCFLSGGSYSYTVDDFKCIYEQGILCFNSTTNNISDGLSYYNGSKLSNFDVITLNGTFESNKGLKPKEIKSINNSNKLAKTNYFIFDEELNKQVFYFGENETTGEKSYISYDLNLERTNTIVFRFKLDDIGWITKPLISICSDTAENLLVFVDSNNRLRVKIGSSTVSSTYFTVENNKWYQAALMMNDTQLYLALNGFRCLILSNTTEDIKNNTTFFGVDFTKSYSLHGCMEMLEINNSKYLTYSEVKQIFDTHVSVSQINEYDSIGRITNKKFKVNNLTLTNQYTYKTRGTNITTPLIASETLIDGKKQEYTYDSYGNVTQKTIYSSTNTLEEQEIYTYDTLFRLIQEQHKTYTNGTISNELKKTYTYDTNGNRLTSIETENGNVVKDYSYYYDTTHKDRLSYINEELDRETKVSISYEDSFNKPSSIINEGTTYNLTWRGRNLTQIGNNKYTYNSQGLRIKKEVDNIVTNYIYEGSKIVGLKVLEDEVEITLIFNYDHQNKLMGLSIDNKEYIYIRDILGNINGIIDQEGKVVVYYKYDAWGNLLKEDIKIENLASKYNPLIYKGYMYDRESKLYYLKSRYYNPKWGRFISMDKVEYVNPKDVQGLNLYAYCNNNPVMYYDPSGHAWDTIFDVLSLFGSIADFIENPSWENAGWLLLDTICALIPFIPTISGLRHANKIDDLIDLNKTYGYIDNFSDAGGVIRKADELDFVDDGWDLVQGLNRTDDGFTISNANVGRQIHSTFMKPFRIDVNNIADGIDKVSNIVFELKPYNKRNIKKGIKQLYRYRNALEKNGYGVYKMVLVVY